jgi:hypothetical protein
MQNKATASRRRVAADLYGDGTGVMGTVSSVSEANLASGNFEVTLKTGNSDRGHVGMFEFGDLLLGKQSGGSARAPTETAGANFYAYRVKSKNRKQDKVTLECVDSSGTVITDVTATNLVAGDALYRIGQPTIPNLASISDYGTATEVPAGLESLAANDGRTVHGITMSGATAGTRLSQSGDPLDARMIQEAMDTVKVNVGKGQYKWSQMTMAPENHAKFINSRETDRRFVQVTDAKRGTKCFAYIHEDDEVKAVTSEFVSKKRIWGLPENKSGKDRVMEYYGSDYKPVKVPGGGEFHLKPSGDGGHVNMVSSYLHGILVYICKHPAAIWCVEDFT